MAPPVAANKTAAIIFSHGLGDSSAGWAFLVQQFGPMMPWVKWVLPDAPTQAVTLNMGMKMPAWFDLYGLTPDAPEDEEGLLRSVEKIRSLVKQELNGGISPGRIVVGGFSQGAAISILTGLMSDDKLGGVVSLSGFLPLAKKMKELKGPFVAQLPVFWAHGTDDQVVRYQWGSSSVEFMKRELSMTEVEFKSYPGLTHSSSPKELADLSQWLLTRLPSQ